ncbi:hypothetical protein ACQEPB_00355 [Novosphingobium fluoreni]|uniref:hypothetical protein n=1 Tax=Novosphingobium fluoreni TaxID=1391222 RepID=UPI003DA02493
MRILRRALRRWLGVPDAQDIQAIVHMEIDADEVWRAPKEGRTFADQRQSLSRSRRTAQAFGRREDTRA